MNDEFSFGERIAIGLAEKCARLEAERDEVQKDAGAWKDLTNRRTEERDKFSAEAARLLDRVRALEPANETLGNLNQKLARERDEALQAVRRLVEGIEKALERADVDEIPTLCWGPYKDARKLLGCPVQILPGGFEGSHFHFSGFDSDRDTCDTCADYAEGHTADEKKESE